MNYSQQVWNQLRNITAGELIKALERDGWTKGKGVGSAIPFVKIGNPETKRVAIHFHPHKTYGPKLLKGLLHDIGWTEDDLKRLRLI